VPDDDLFNRIGTTRTTVRVPLRLLAVSYQTTDYRKTTSRSWRYRRKSQLKLRRKSDSVSGIDHIVPRPKANKHGKVLKNGR
jgi:hypothetical protein